MSSGEGGSRLSCRHALVGLVVLAGLVMPAAVRAADGGLRPDGSVLVTTSGAGWEPTVAVSPLDGRDVAVISQRHSGPCGVETPIRISHDGGRTFAASAGLPWARGSRCPDHHGVIAWGPGGPHGTLWWGDVTHGPDGYRPTVAFSRDEGRSWSVPLVYRGTPGWIGGLPDIAVDRNPASPNYGAVYLAYNWLADRLGPGLHVVGTRDGGRTLAAVEVPAVPTVAGHPAAERVSYRLQTAPDGALYVAWYQADLRIWNSAAVFSRGGLANVGRVGFGVARLMLRPDGRSFGRGRSVLALALSRNAYTTSSLAAPGTGTSLHIEQGWTYGLAVAPDDGRLYLAAGDYGLGSPRGRIVVARSADGLTWQRSSLSALPPSAGAAQSAVRPVIAALPGGQVVVAFHGLTDQAVLRGSATVGTYAARSDDGGLTFGSAVVLEPGRYRALAIAAAPNGPGLRDSLATAGPDRLVYAYGDGQVMGRITVRLARFGLLASPPPGPPVRCRFCLWAD